MIWLHYLRFYVAHQWCFNQKQLKGENEDEKGGRVMDLQTHLSSRETSGILIQIIHV